MGEFKFYPKGNTRQLIDFNRFEELTGSKLFICLDRGVMEVLRFFLNSRAGWKSTYYTEQNETGYTTPTNEQMDLLEEKIAEANIDMSSCEDLNNSLQDIVSALGNLAGGSGSGGCGCIADSGSDVTEINDVPSVDIPQGSDPLPPGFGTQEEYDTYRCNAAQWLYDNYVQTLRNWAGLFGVVGGLTLAVISGLLLLTVPPVGLVAILSALGILAGIDIGLLATLSDIADEMDANEADTVCQLYNADSTDAAQTVLQEAAQAAVVALDLGLLQATYEQVTANLISREQAEVLFNDSDLGDIVGDCSSCGGAAIWAINPGICTATITTGSFQADEETTVENCEGNFFGTTRAGMGFGSNPVSTQERAVQFTDVTGGGNFYVTVVNDANPDPGISDSYTAAELAALSVNAYQIQIARLDASDVTPFTVSLVVSVI